MKKFVKSILSLSIGSVIALSNANAATYELDVISEITTHKNTFGQFQNGLDDEFSISATDSFDFPVVVQELFDDLIVFQDDFGAAQLGFSTGVLEDVDAFVDGVPTANDLDIAVSFLQAQGSLLFQQVADQSVFVDFGNGPNLVTIWDVEFSDPSFSSFGELTRSTEDFISGISERRWLYGSGSAPHLPIDANDGRTFWLSDFDLKGYVSIDDGNSAIEVEAPENTYGGVSAVLDMDEVNGISTGVGFASVGLIDSVVNSIQDETTGCAAFTDDVEEALCTETLREDLYRLNAYKWSFDGGGNPTAGESLGLLITPNENDLRNHESFALAVNRDGDVAGYSTGFFLDTDLNPIGNPAVDEAVSTYAVVFENDGDIIDLTDDHSEFFASRANDISDNGFVVGFVTLTIQGTQRTNFFYVDMNQDNIEMIRPDGFFTSSSSVARAINEGGLIVGDGEVEQNAGSTTDPRRRNAFLYDIARDEFTNLNDFLSCDEQDRFEIVEARDINDNDEITATALVEIEQLDARGEVEIDEIGNPLTEFVLQAVKLRPTSGEIENCAEENGELIERDGASISLLFLFLTSLIHIRRKY